MKLTFWLYYNGKVIEGIRAESTATDEEVKAKALHYHHMAPCVYADYPLVNPGEQERRIRQSVVTAS